MPHICREITKLRTKLILQYDVNEEYILLWFDLHFEYSNYEYNHVC